MPPFRKATESQETFFADNDLICPLTEDTAQSIIGYITQERNGGTRQERRATVYEAQKKWIGHRVCHIGNGQTRGKVRHLTARSYQMMISAYASARALRERGMECGGPSRFMAVVEKNKSKVVVIGLEHLYLES